MIRSIGAADILVTGSVLSQSCFVCAARTSAGRKPRALLHERPRADRPFHALEMDIKGPLPTTLSSFQYIFVICSLYDVRRLKRFV